MMGWLLAAWSAWACQGVDDATVYGPDGAHEAWTVQWEGAEIVYVGPTAQAPPCDAVTRGGHVTAGLVAVSTHLGIVEVELEQGTRDDRVEGGRVHAAVQPTRAYNPSSVVVPITRKGGITTALVRPSGGFVAGQIGAVSLSGALGDSVISHGVGLSVASREANSKAMALVRMAELLDDARHYQAGRPYEGISDLSASRLDLDALLPVLTRRMPMVVHVDRASDILAWLAFAEAQAIDLVIDGAAEGWRVADALAAQDVPVIVDPLIYGAGGFDQIHGRPDNAALLDAAGVPVILTLRETHNARALRLSAGNAVRGGLDHARALAAVTETPARVFGLDGRGILEAGAVADLVVWSEDPLDVPARVKGVWIGGQAQGLRTRQDALTEAWRALPRPWWPDPDSVAPTP